MVDVKGLLNKMLLVAKEDRARYKYSEEEAFVPKVMFIGPENEVFVTPAQWRGEREKYAMMSAAAEVARKTFAQAIMLASDTRWVLFEPFNNYFHVEPPRSMERAETDAYQQRYLAILREHDGQVKNLPRQLWSEAVMVAIKGPRCGTHHIMAPYDRGPNDTVHYLPPERDQDNARTQMNLIPEWWH
jgi:hypothetical protein